ncbi:MAG TPA: LamG domain-containing protein [Verrucomicrobiae bacterium]|nr:LamG domain-containing protein [Verrucomicrobiae bacterium]
MPKLRHTTRPVTLTALAFAASLLQIAPAEANPIATWDFDGNLHSNDNNPAYDLTLGGNATLVPSPWGMAAQFHGGTYPITDQSTFSNPSMDRLDTAGQWNNSSFNGGLTVMGWVNAASTTAGAILGHDSSSFSLNDFGFQLTFGPYIELLVRDNNDNRSLAIANSTPLSANQWYHVAATWAGGNSDNFVIYVNGQAVASSVNHIGSFAGLNGANALPLRIGADLGNSLQDAKSFNGMIDHLSLYSGAITPDQVAADYAATAIPVPVPEPATTAAMTAGGLGLIVALELARNRGRSRRQKGIEGIQSPCATTTA